VVQGFGGEARFVVENYGDSELAKRFGVKRYPAIFVDDVLVATPKDFGFYGSGEGERSGRYAPIRSAASHERLRTDLTRMVGAILAGRGDEARALAAPSQAGEIAAYPSVSLTTLDGRRLTRADLAGRVVLVEFWATWCPPCRGTLRWLDETKRRHGDEVAVIALALESDEAQVREVAGGIGAAVAWGMGTPERVRAFGDVGAVPTLLVFDRRGRTAGTWFGAPPGLHGEVEAKLSALLAAR
jgi:thiol-disulfide isomerase/thioredoxin